MAAIIRNTGDIRTRLLRLWQQIEKKEISASEARLHISVARAILETLKVEMAAAHIAQQNIPSVSLGALPIASREQ